MHKGVQGKREGEEEGVMDRGSPRSLLYFPEGLDEGQDIIIIFICTCHVARS